MCLVAFQKMFRKIFSDFWLCSWKYHRKHIFYLLLTFSHIFSVTKRLYNIIYSLKHKQNPEKNHKIRTNEGEIAIGAIEIGEITIDAIAIGAIRASRDPSIAIARRSKRRSWSRSVMLAARCVDCDRTKLQSWSRLTRSREDRSGDCDCDRDRRYHASRWCRRTVMSRSILSFSPSLSLSLSLLFSKAGSTLKWK